MPAPINMIRDFRTVTVRGAVNKGRARVLWAHRLLRVFTLEGCVAEVRAEEPVRRPGYLMTWDVDTAEGPITLSGKCITCGGARWWRIASQSKNELWRTAA